MQIKAISTIKSQLGEGPIWCASKQVLYYVDIDQKLIHRFNPESKETQSFKAPSKIGFITQNDTDKWVVGLEKGLAYWHVDTNIFDPIFCDVEIGQNTRINDGKMDNQGRIWFGTLDYDFKNPIANFYCYDGQLHKVFDKVTISNGLDWSPDGKVFYYIDTTTRQIKSYRVDGGRSYEFEKIGSISVPKTDGVPDGMTIDKNGYIWVAMWNGSKVVTYNPKTLKKIGEIQLPTPFVTCPCFGGADKNQLYITTSGQDLDDDYAGRVYTINLGDISYYREAL